MDGGHGSAGRDPRMLLRLAAGAARRLSPATIDPDELDDLVGEMVCIGLHRGWMRGRFLSMEWLYHSARRSLYPSSRRKQHTPPPPEPEPPNPDDVLAAFSALADLCDEHREAITRVVLAGEPIVVAAEEMGLERHRVSRSIRAGLAEMRKRMDAVNVPEDER